MERIYLVFDDIREFLFGSKERTFNEPMDGVIDFKNHQQFVNILESHRPTFVAFTVPGCHLSRRILEAMSQTSTRLKLGVNFVRVNCAEHEDFCRSRKPTNLPLLEVFHTQKVHSCWNFLSAFYLSDVLDEQPFITGEANVRVERFRGDMSVYGIYAFLKRKGFLEHRSLENRLAAALDVTNPTFLFGGRKRPEAL